MPDEVRGLPLFIGAGCGGSWHAYWNGGRLTAWRGGCSAKVARLLARLVCLFLLTPAVGAGSGCSWAMQNLLSDPVPEAREPKFIRELLFADSKKIAIVSGAGVVQVSLDGGRQWFEVPGVAAHNLALASSGALWGCSATVDKAGARGEVVMSPDWGRSWTSTDLQAESESPEIGGSDRLPVQFINDPHSPPLLVTYNGQLWRPVIAASQRNWARLGVPAFTSSFDPQPRVRRVDTGVEHRKVVYLAARFEATIAVSTDGGESWSTNRLPGIATPSARVLQVRCSGSTCHALVQEGRTSSAVFRTEVGHNEWSLVTRLHRDKLAKVLVDGKSLPEEVDSFIANDLVAGDHELSVVGFGRTADLSRRWGGGAVIGKDLTVTPLPALPAASDALYAVRRAPDGAIWAAGDGLFRLEGGRWQQLWAAAR